MKKIRYLILLIFSISTLFSISQSTDTVDWADPSVQKFYGPLKLQSGLTVDGDADFRQNVSFSTSSSLTNDDFTVTGEWNMSTLYLPENPEFYGGARDEVKILAALAVVDVVRFSAIYTSGTDATIVIPANKTLDFTNGGSLENFDTITFNNTKIINPDNHQIFSTTTKFTITANTEYCMPEWFGAETDDSADDIDEIEASFNVADYVRLTDYGVYNTSSTIDIPRLKTLGADIVSIIIPDNSFTIIKSTRKTTKIKNIKIDLTSLPAYDDWAILYAYRSNFSQDTLRFPDNCDNVSIYGSVVQKAKGIKLTLQEDTVLIQPPGNPNYYSYNSAYWDIFNNVYMHWMDTGVLIQSYTKGFYEGAPDTFYIVNGTGDTIATPTKAELYGKTNGTVWSNLNIDAVKTNLVIDTISLNHVFNNIQLQTLNTGRAITIKGDYNYIYGDFSDFSTNDIYITGAANHVGINGHIYHSVIQDEGHGNSFNGDYLKAYLTQTVTLKDTTDVFIVGTFGTGIAANGLNIYNVGVKGSIGATGGFYIPGTGGVNRSRISMTGSRTDIFSGSTGFIFYVGSTGKIVFNATDIYPVVSLDIDLGTSLYRFKDLYSDNFADNGTNITIGTGEGSKDYILTFDGENNDGTITYMEDEDRFDFDNQINSPTISSTTINATTTNSTTINAIGKGTFAYIALTPQATAPASPLQGYLYCNTDGVFFGYNGLYWDTLSPDWGSPFTSVNYSAIYWSMTNKPTLAVANAQDVMLKTLEDNGVWAKLDVFFWFAQYSNTDSEALIDWVHPTGTAAELSGVPTFTSLAGFTMTSPQYIDLKYNPTTDYTHYSLNSASAGIALGTNTAGAGYAFGYINAGQEGVSLLPSSGTQSASRMNFVVAEANANTSGQGIFVISREGAANYDWYRNNNTPVTITETATGEANGDIVVGAVRYNVTVVNNLNNRYQMFFAGEGLSDADVGFIMSAVETCLDAQGYGVIP